MEDCRKAGMRGNTGINLGKTIYLDVDKINFVGKKIVEKTWKTNNSILQNLKLLPKNQSQFSTVGRWR
jgi:hypothetical protein